MQPIPVITRGAQINSALYLAAAFVAGLVTHNPLAWRLALAAIGVTYLSYLAQMPKLVPEWPGDPTPRAVWPSPTLPKLLVIWSITLGVASGIALLF